MQTELTKVLNAIEEVKKDNGYGEVIVSIQNGKIVTIKKQKIEKVEAKPVTQGS